MKQLYGLLGEKLGHSLSPAIHSLILKKLQLEGSYHLFEVEKERIEDAIFGMRALGIKGLNVTIPYKEEVMKYLHEIAPEAEKIGAVNTIALEDDKVLGYNTDYYGLEKMFDYYGIPIQGKRAVILGTGGVAKATKQFLRDKGIGEIILVSRDVLGAKEKFQDIQVASYEEIRTYRGDLLINCTPIGMFPSIEEVPVDREVISTYHWVIDLIYNPAETILLKQAKQLGIPHVNGLYMLVGQAVKAQEIWNKTTISQELVSEVYKESLYFHN